MKREDMTVVAALVAIWGVVTLVTVAVSALLGAVTERGFFFTVFVLALWAVGFGAGYFERGGE